MTKLVRRHRILCCAALCWVAASCTRHDDAAADTAAAPGAALAIPADDTTFTPRAELVPAERIYYTLTQHEWYAHGEPLLHEGRAYVPAGIPVVASLPEMQAAGEYQGVTYYRRQGESDAVLYVPVFHGYWQQFRGEAASSR